MAQIIQIAPDAQPEDEEFWILVDPDHDGHSPVVEFDRDHARFVYGPRSFKTREDATARACHWADQYGIPKVYVH